MITVDCKVENTASVRYSNGMSTKIDISTTAPEVAEKKRLNNAQRQARWRERRRAEGMQIMVSVPAEIAKALQEGKLVKVVTEEDLHALKIGHECLKLTSWRRATVSKFVSLDES